MGMHDESLANEASQRLIAPLTDLVERAHAAGALRPEIEVSDVGIMILCLTTIADVTGEVSADVWRRYLPIFLDGLRTGSPLPVPADQRRGDAHGVRVVQGTDGAHPPLTVVSLDRVCDAPVILCGCLLARRLCRRDACAGRRGLRAAQPARARH